MKYTQHTKGKTNLAKEKLFASFRVFRGFKNIGKRYPARRTYGQNQSHHRAISG
jgi:hypothetical protein